MHCITNLDALIEGNPESGHARICHCDRSTLALFLEQGHDAAPATNNISITTYRKPGAFNTRIGIGLDEHLLGAKLGRTIEIDGIDGFIRAYGHDLLYAAVYSCIYHILGTDYIGLNCFEGIIFASRYLLKSGGMYHHINFIERSIKALFIPDVADEVTHWRVSRVRKHLAHIVLFQLASTENYQPPGVIIAKHYLSELSAERACSTCN